MNFISNYAYEPQSARSVFEPSPQAVYYPSGCATGVSIDHTFFPPASSRPAFPNEAQNNWMVQGMNSPPATPPTSPSPPPPTPEQQKRLLRFTPQDRHLVLKGLKPDLMRQLIDHPELQSQNEGDPGWLLLRLYGVVQNRSQQLKGENDTLREENVALRGETHGLREAFESIHSDNVALRARVQATEDQNLQLAESLKAKHDENITIKVEARRFARKVEKVQMDLVSKNNHLERRVNAIVNRYLVDAEASNANVRCALQRHLTPEYYRLVESKLPTGDGNHYAHSATMEEVESSIESLTEANQESKLMLGALLEVLKGARWFESQPVDGWIV
ncbi:hypothetical protein BJ508DRAFT_309157 [Ascobolus immersus RN42]|uniref:Uncharacterized protein n=1 Tax=Ascobolus immersus RN42 TaxID=1160509 RepID=A0A3N4HXU7_ASCIM|nr:hypothetical protein BJ508DRAFT_309157 [Ascobolus immersus RN42]